MKKENIDIFKNDLKQGILTKNSYFKILNLENEMKKNESGKYKISVIIPTHNRLKLLKKCIESIFSQTYQNFEIIIIDDVSSDNTSTYFSMQKDKRIIYNRNKHNLGAGLNRQKGYNLSSGDFIIFLDDDDYFINDNFFSDIIKIFENENNIKIILGNSYIHYEDEDTYKLHKLNIPKKIDIIEYLSKFDFYYKKPTSSFPAVFRKEQLEKANFKNMKMMNDTSIYLRSCIPGGVIYFYDKIVGIYRMHSKNYTFNVKADFIIENLEEKKYVYEYLKSNKIIKNVKTWYSKELYITISYYMSGSDNDKKNIYLVLNWVKNNAPCICYLKARLCYFKHILKGKKNEN